MCHLPRHHLAGNPAANRSRRGLAGLWGDRSKDTGTGVGPVLDTTACTQTRATWLLHCSHAGLYDLCGVMFFCCRADILSWDHSVKLKLQYWSTTMWPSRGALLPLCCPLAMLSCCHAVMLSWCHAAMLSNCNPVSQHATHITFVSLCCDVMKLLCTYVRKLSCFRNGIQILTSKLT